MKLLGWMHRKLRQNNNDVFKEFATTGGGITGGIAPSDPITFLASANDYFSNDASDTNHPSRPDNSAADLFTFGGSGLLTIGTLGIAAVAVPEEGDEEDDDFCDVDINANNSDATTEERDEDHHDGAATPAFTYPAPPPAAVEKAVVAVEAIAEKDDDSTTEDDLMVVSAELEKVLCGGRNSGTAAGDLVASARASFAAGVDCPLQGFLFGSPVSDAESRQDRRDSLGGGRRTSLGELFMRTRFADEKVALVAVEEDEDGKAGGDEGVRAGKGGKVMKRKVKDEKSAGTDGAPASAAKNKFQKILQIFHRKVYPESTALARSLTKKSRKRGGTDDEPPASPKLQCRKEPRLPGFGCCARRSSFGGGRTSPDVDEDEHNGSKSGHWIRTDADYLVLEL